MTISEQNSLLYCIALCRQGYFKVMCWLLETYVVDANIMFQLRNAWIIAQNSCSYCSLSNKRFSVTILCKFCPWPLTFESNLLPWFFTGYDFCEYMCAHFGLFHYYMFKMICHFFNNLLILLSWLVDALITVFCFKTTNKLLLAFLWYFHNIWILVAGICLKDQHAALIIFFFFLLFFISNYAHIPQLYVLKYMRIVWY